MAEMQVMEVKESEVKSCNNCSNYGWQQPEDRDTILKCAKCKLAMYCTKQCQQEHWMKVHKQHCKYMAHLMVLPNSWHDAACCPICKQEKDTGKLQMSESNNPILGCASILVDQEPLPFPLGEMTGKFTTKAEATVSLMQRILLKLKQINHPAWLIDTELSEELWCMLAVTRTGCWNAYVQANPGPRLDRVFGSFIGHGVLQVIHLIKKIDDSLNSARFKDQNEFRHWDTLKILANFLYKIPLELDRVTTEHLGLPEMCEELLSIRMTSAQYNNIWQQILDTMPGRLVPYKSLVEVMCGGQLWKVCYGCSKKFKVATVVFVNSEIDDIKNNKGPVHMIGAIQTSLCGDPLCLLQCEDEIYEQDLKLTMLYTKMGCEAVAFRCDYCAMPGSSGNKGHRCSRCLTKVYCGRECRDLDWKVHKLVCREGEEERKKKGGKQSRTEQGKEVFDVVVRGVGKVQPFPEI